MGGLALMLAASVNAGTVLALAGLGLLINERAGVLNLGAEGMMLIGALAGYATALHAPGAGMLLGYLAAAAAGAVMAALFGWLAIGIGTNQYATGLALSLFGVGFTAFAGKPFVDRQLAERGRDGIPWLRDLPLVGPALFGYHLLVYLAVALAVGLTWFLFRSRAGLLLRAVGESPESAHALGHRVRAIRMLAVIAGGALCGLAGAYVSLAYTHLWVENLIAGRGWIALALTTFATWRPARILLGAYLFGGLTMLQFHLQQRGVQIESHLLGMLPYLATVIVLVLISRRAAWIRHNMPASLGRIFRPGT
ncbi:MAG TPA: ABC transporter permease [Polyangia bacterium]|nr:ABC transporter permease [Polyangia bacterium]